LAAVSKELRRLIDDKNKGWPATVRARDWARAKALLYIAQELRDGEYPDPQGELSAELEARGKEAALPGSTTRSDDHATLAAEWTAFGEPASPLALMIIADSWSSYLSALAKTRPGQLPGPETPCVDASKQILHFLQHGQEEAGEERKEEDYFNSISRTRSSCCSGDGGLAKGFRNSAAVSASVCETHE